MATQEKSLRGSIGPSGTLNADVRTSLTGQFLMAAAMQVRAAEEFESRPSAEVTENDTVAHRGFVVGAIMQSTAALECEVWELTAYGHGHHLGSNGTDTAARDFLVPIAEVIDSQSVLERYQLVLHLLKKTPLNRGEQPWQDTALVVRLRNELVHYKSRWGEELDRTGLLRALQSKKHPKPPFVLSSNFFPYECLSAACASWTARSCVAFLDSFYASLGFPGRLEPFRPRLLQ